MASLDGLVDFLDDLRDGVSSASLSETMPGAWPWSESGQIPHSVGKSSSPAACLASGILSGSVWRLQAIGSRDRIGRLPSS